PEIESGIVRYGYDPANAESAIEQLGYRRGPDGTYTDSLGQPLKIEVRSGGDVDYQTKPMLTVADYWRRLGVTVDTVVIPEQRIRDLQYRSTYPGFELDQSSADFDQVATLQSDRIPLAQNNYRSAAGKNYARYSNPQMDALVPRYYATIPIAPRMDIARQIIHQITDQVVWMGIYYTPLVTAVDNRLLGVAGRKVSAGSSGWNAQD